ncbi:probable disease resistance protein At5g63020 [Pistacia vera]|uniref:probable disease resistance protein At5g63020 n=1 Tax=Pistacia vera TaxID=55513 RepID=UPI0012635A82|nr:probable disease resistance protein At5g63020 [Pistacia vera]
MGNFCSFSISCDAIFSRCLNCTVAKTAYIRDLEKNLGVLQTDCRKLIEARNDVTRRVMIAEEQHEMKRLEQVQGWLSRVEAVGTEVEEIIKDSSQEIERLCLGGYCSRNCKSSYKFGKRVAEKLRAVATLKSEGDFKDVAERVLKDSVNEIPIDPMIVGMQSIFDKVWRCLGEKQVGIIGLHGTGGVGKTTLLTQINNNFCNEQNDFDVVIWVVVSKDQQVEKIQEEIGEKIGLSSESWKKKSLPRKAQDLLEVLRKKKFLLLLDDIWERVDLTEVGIPHPDPNNGSKIVFTTRFVEVCGQMEAHKHFRVEFLENEEAWKLFRSKVGEDTLKNHPNILELAKNVAKECGGLPLALITIGRAMAFKKTPGEWSYAIQVLQRSASEFQGMDKVYPRLKFTYDSLPNDKVRSCFLYCSLLPEDFIVRKEGLIDCWIGEGFLDEYEGIGARNQGYHFIGILLNACLLEEVSGVDDSVKMHDVIRDMALWIACKVEKEKENFLVHAGARLTEAPKADKWIGVRRISLMENQIENLSEVPTCPRLLTLFLNSNRLKTINNDFFQSMSSLKLLDLSVNPLTKLPSGISKLVSLQHLDLSWTQLEELPKDLKALVNLKCLNLDRTYHLRTIPRKLISEFSMLRVLRMFYCGDSILFGGNEFLVEELLCLEVLNVLSIDLRSNSALQNFFSSRKLHKLIDSLRLHRLENIKSLNVCSLATMKHLDTLDISDCEDLEEVKIDIICKVQEIREPHGFENLRSVFLVSCHKLRDLTWLILAPNLRSLSVLNCFDMEEIIDISKFGEVQKIMGNLNPFAKVNVFTLQVLPKLKSIHRNALSLPLLQKMNIFECPLLKKLPLDSSRAITNKREFIIRGDKDWWEELEWEDETTQNVFLPFFRSWR